MLKSLPIVDAASSTACGVAAPLAVPIEGDPASRRGTFALVSLGCPKNLVDSERMLGLLRDDGWQFVAEPRGADLVIVNTCAFLEASRQESYGVIDEMLALKRSGATRVVGECPEFAASLLQVDVRRTAPEAEVGVVGLAGPVDAAAHHRDRDRVIGRVRGHRLDLLRQFDEGLVLDPRAARAGDDVEGRQAVVDHAAHPPRGDVAEDRVGRLDLLRLVGVGHGAVAH